MTSEHVQLAWADFESKAPETFKQLWDQQDFADVTLATEDGHQVLAHKLILSSSSQFFRNLLLRNPHKNPILCLLGIKQKDLLQILKYIYLGQTDVEVENVETFLDIGKQLHIKGLLHDESAHGDKDLDENQCKDNAVSSEITGSRKNRHNHPFSNDTLIEDEDPSEFASMIDKHKYLPPQENVLNTNMTGLKDLDKAERSPQKEAQETMVGSIILKKPAVSCDVQDCLAQLISNRDLLTHKYRTHGVQESDFEDMDNKIKSMMEASGKVMFSGKQKGTQKGSQKRKVMRCKVCGREGQASHIKGHIEAKHITGLPHMCNVCKKMFKTRSSLNGHRLKAHRHIVTLET